MTILLSRVYNQLCHLFAGLSTECGGESLFQGALQTNFQQRKLDHMQQNLVFVTNELLMMTFPSCQKWMKFTLWKMNQ